MPFKSPRYSREEYAFVACSTSFLRGPSPQIKTLTPVSFKIGIASKSKWIPFNSVKEPQYEMVNGSLGFGKIDEFPYTPGLLIM